MRLVIMLMVCVLLCIPVGNAEVLWGDLSLEPADEQARNRELSTIVSLTRLDSINDLKYGRISDVDIVDTTVAIDIFHHDITQIWLWSVQGEFLGGFELKETFPPSTRKLVLSPDGTSLLWYGKGAPILGLNTQNGQPEATVYSPPMPVAKYQYRLPERSSYKMIAANSGKVVVQSPEGEQVVIVDFADEYAAYCEEKKRIEQPYIILIAVGFSIFIFILIRSIIFFTDKDDDEMPPSPLL